MSNTADVLILGGGLYGCATAYNLANLGVQNVTILEQGAVCAGGTAKSCVIVRTHYSIETNLIHAVESLKIFCEFDSIVGGEIGWHRTGYVILGPEDHAEPMRKVFANQNRHGIDTAELTPIEAHELHPLLSFHDVGVIGYDTQTGYADPYLTTTAYANRARQLGVTIRAETGVTGISVNGEMKTIQTTVGDFLAPIVILAVGPWTQLLGDMIGVTFPYENSRHKVVTLKAEDRYKEDWPIVKDLTTKDKIYFRPETGGVVLVGTGDHGEPILDPADGLSDDVEMDHVSRIDRLISNRMPAYANAQVPASWTGPYDITPDWNPIVGPVTGYDGMFVAVGFSGHGFKLAPTIAESLAQTVLGEETRIPIADYAMTRFAAGKELHGAYGIGSIS